MPNYLEILRLDSLNYSKRTVESTVHCSRHTVRSILQVAADALADVSGMAFDCTLPREERLARFVKRAVNPYCFSVGGVGVKIEFAEGGPSLQETLTAFLIRQKSGL